MNNPVFYPLAAAPPITTARQTKMIRSAAVALLSMGLASPAHMPSQVAKPMTGASPAVTQLLLMRRYQDGEKIAYTISCLNRARSTTTEYEAHAEGVVSKDSSGIFVENLAWTDLHLNDEQIRLSAASRAFREPLSLAQGAKLSIPPLGKVQEGLIGPITDLLTIYADVKIAMNQKPGRVGDHAYVKFGAPNSWADGTHVVVGEDSIDFDVTLQSIDQKAQTATLLVRHVPPVQPQIKLSAPWMSERVGNTANNWVQVEKGSDGKYVASVGQETFNVEIKVALATGRILSATMDNPVEISERVCTDAALAACGAPQRYTVHRQITLRAE
ncbi:MAG: hypothetical protein ABR987_05025 [Terracidiphilus sp.]